MGNRWVWWSTILAAFPAAFVSAGLSFALIFVLTQLSSPDWLAAALISSVGAVLSYAFVLRYGSFITAALLATIVSVGLAAGGFQYGRLSANPSPVVSSRFIVSVAFSVVFVLIVVGIAFLGYFIIHRWGKFLVRQNVRIACVSAFCLAFLLGLVVVTPLVVLGGFTVAEVVERNYVERTRESLQVTGNTSEVFWPDLITDLPAPAQRFFLHAIKSGTPLASSVELEVAGSVKLGVNWEPITAKLLLTPERGFVSETIVNWRLDGETGVDQINTYYLDGKARRRTVVGWLGGSTRTGAEYSRNAARTLAVKSALYIPASLLPQRGAVWEGIDDDSVSVTLTSNGEPKKLTLAVDPDGRLQEITIGTARLRTDGESTFGGYTIPLHVWTGLLNTAGSYNETQLDSLVEARFK